MKDKPETWKRKTSKEIADCRVFKVREDFASGRATAPKAHFLSWKILIG